VPKPLLGISTVDWVHSGAVPPELIRYRPTSFRVNSDVVGLASKRCQISATQLPDVIMRDAEQRTTRLIVV
jgi:hypothetical protein